MSRRKTIPTTVKLIVALRQLGFTVAEVEYDHDPALSLRRWNAEANDTDPPANHPDFIVIRTKADHARKTFGLGGEKRITTAGSDIANFHKGNRLTEQQTETRRRMMAKAEGKPREKKWGSGQKMRGRGFQKRHREQRQAT